MLGLKGNLKSACPVSSSSIPGPLNPMTEPLLGIKLIPILPSTSTSMPLIGPVTSPVSQVICPVIRSGRHPVSSMVLPLDRDCLVISLVGRLHLLRSSKATDTGLRHSQTFSCSRAACSQGIHLKQAPLRKSPALLAWAWLISRHESCQR
ncbi:TPA: hypothetical protein ACH3X3_010584 [Trebouxia sp. C0006]